MDRRSFLKVFGGTAAATLFGGGIDAAAVLEKPAAEPKPLPKRALGKTGEKLSIVGFGGLSLNRMDQSVANNSVSMAIDRGLNYFDVAPEYGDAEERLGIALRGKRNKIFLSCKTARRNKEGAKRELQRSLQRLKTDHFDLYQFHHIRTKEETERALGPGGAIEAFLEAKKKGQVRFLGFSAHTTKAALLAMEKFPFDTVMFPINFMEWLKIGFGPAVVKKAKERDGGHCHQADVSGIVGAGSGEAGKEMAVSMVPAGLGPGGGGHGSSFHPLSSCDDGDSSKRREVGPPGD